MLDKVVVREYYVAIRHKTSYVVRGVSIPQNSPFTQLVFRFTGTSRRTDDRKE